MEFLNFFLKEIFNSMKDITLYISKQSLHRIIYDECQKVDILSIDVWESFVKNEVLQITGLRCENLIWNIDVFVHETEKVIFAKRVVKQWLKICYRPPKFNGSDDEGGTLYHLTRKNSLIG